MSQAMRSMSAIPAAVFLCGLMVQGKLDITAQLVEDSRHIESRVELMGW